MELNLSVSVRESNKLISEAKRGIDEAYIKLHKLYLPLIESMVAKYMKIGGFPIEETEDVRQESEMAFFGAVKAYDTSQDKVSFGLYAKICIKNRLISYLRRFGSDKNNGRYDIDDIPFDENDIEIYSDGGKSPLDYIIRDENSAEINKTVSKVLTPYEKRIFSLYIQGKSAKEIALSVAKPEKSVNNAIYRIRVKIRNMLPSGYSMYIR